LKAELHLGIVWDFLVEPIGSIGPRKISSLLRFVPRFYYRFFAGRSLTHIPSLQLSFGGKEDMVVVCILVEADWHLV
jgi:hypothetical protein